MCHLERADCTPVPETAAFRRPIAHRDLHSYTQQLTFEMSRLKASAVSLSASDSVGNIGTDSSRSLIVLRFRSSVMEAERLNMRDDARFA